MSDVGSKVYGVITNVTGGGFWDVSLKRSWDMVFTNKGLLFVNLGEVSLKRQLLFPVGFDWDAYIRPYLADSYKEERKKIEEVPLNKLLELNKRNFFIGYDEVSQIRIRSSPVLCGFDFKSLKGNKGFTFSKGQLEKTKNLFSKFLADKLKKKGWGLF